MAAAPWGHIPPLGHPAAPAFYGDATQLHTYLRDIEGWKTEGMTDEKAVSTCVKYVRSDEDRKLFELLEQRWKAGQPRGNWSDFRKSVIARYPEAFDDETAYTIESLEQHISRAPESTFQSPVEFQRFMNTFEVIAEELIAKKLMTEAGINAKLCNAIPQSEVKRTTLQKDYLGMEASAVAWRDLGERYRKMLATGSPGSVQRERTPQKPVKEEPTVKNEPTETAAMIAAISALNAQIQTLTEVQRQQAQQRGIGGGGGGYARGPYPGAQPRDSQQRTPIWGNQPSGRGFEMDCHYCGRLGHPMMQCELYAHDQGANGVFYHARSNTLKIYNQFTDIPTGASPAAAVAVARGARFIPMPGPQTANEPKPAPQTSTNMMSVVATVTSAEKVPASLARAEPRIEEWKSDEEEEIPQKEESADEAEDDEAEQLLAQVHATMAQIQTLRKKKKKSGESSAGESGKRTLEVVLPTMKELMREQHRAAIASKKGIEARERSAERAAEELGKAPQKAERKVPQYHFESATDNPEAQARVLEACKDGCVPMTIGDLLAVSDALRARIHTETRRRRVPNTAGGENEKGAEAEEVKMSSVREAAVDDLLTMIMNTQVAPTTSSLMATSDFVRNHLHADTNRRTQITVERSTPTMAFHPTPCSITAESPRAAIAVKETQLWAINAFITDYSEQEEYQLSDVVVDDGSGICAIRRDVAEQLNFPYEHAPILCQQFDGTVVEHGDLIRNLPVTVGSVRVYVQAYVLSNLGPQMILGGPFETVVRLSKETGTSARPCYRLTDPKQGKVTTMVMGHKREQGKKEDF